MSKSDHGQRGSEESIHREYILGVRIVECGAGADADGSQYRFEAPEHQGRTFADPETAELYADVYFCTNGFEEAATGERGVPLEVIGAGRAVLAAYLLTQYDDDVEWVASFFGRKPYRVHDYVEWVEDRAADIREGAEAEGVA